jgi:hypothetical protein
MPDERELAAAKAAPISPEIKRRQDIMEQAIQAGIVKPSKTELKKETPTAGMVSRDKEALARLLTSF